MTKKEIQTNIFTICIFIIIMWFFVYIPISNKDKPKPVKKDTTLSFKELFIAECNTLSKIKYGTSNNSYCNCGYDIIENELGYDNLIKLSGMKEITGKNPKELDNAIANANILCNIKLIIK